MPFCLSTIIGVWFPFRQMQWWFSSVETSMRTHLSRFAMRVECSTCSRKTFVAVENCGENRGSYLTEKATNRGTIKVSPKVLDSLNEEHYWRWKNTGKEPTQNEFIREAIEIARHPERLEFNSYEAHGHQLSEE